MWEALAKQCREIKYFSKILPTHEKKIKKIKKENIKIMNLDGLSLSSLCPVKKSAQKHIFSK